MKGYEYAKKNGMTNAEVKELFNLPSHMSLVPESCDELPEIAEDVIELVEDVAVAIEAIEEVVEDVIEIKSKLDDPEVLSEGAAFSIFILGNKSPFWKK